MSVDGRRFVLLSLFFLAVLGVAASSLWAWFWAGFSLDPDPLSHQQHLDQALAVGLGAGVLTLGALPMGLLRTPWWLVLVVAGLLALLGLVGAHELVVAADAPVRPRADDAWTLTVQQFCYAPTTWPMLLFVLVTPAVRARSLLARRPSPAR
jgi:hypothetical protein